MVKTLVEFATMPDVSEYQTIEDLVNDDRVPYSAHWLRVLCQKEKVEAIKIGSKLKGQWLIHVPSLLAYIDEQEDLGTKKHRPF